MRRALLLLAAAWSAGTAGAQPASDLLQSGIYNQEASGDLDAAIRIYRQILSAGPAQRMYAGQAQFRLGQCLLRKGDQSGAAEAFQAVIRNYPDQPALVARARENMPRPGGLLSAPWKDREVAEYRWTIPGVEDAWSIAYIGPSPYGGAAARIQSLLFSPGMYYLYLDVTRDTMRPIQVSYPGMQRTDPVDGSAYEFGQVAQLLRRMVLAVGRQATIPVILADGSHVALKMMVDAEEDVTVPAGTFPCYRVRLAAPRPHPSVFEGNWPVAGDGEALWLGRGAGRPLVKMASGASKGELTALRTLEHGAQRIYRDPVFGYSFAAPSSWLNSLRADRRAATIDLFDTESEMTIRIAVYLASPAGESLQATADARLRKSMAGARDYTLRGPMTAATMGGNPALSWIADFHYRSGPRDAVEYITCVQGQSATAAIILQAWTADFEPLRPRFQPIVDSFRIR